MKCGHFFWFWAVPDKSVFSYENSRCCTFPRKLACSHAISHALKAFDSPFSLTVSHFFSRARAVGKIYEPGPGSSCGLCGSRWKRKFFISSHPSLLNAWEEEPRNRGFRSLSRTNICTFPRKLACSHAISLALDRLYKNATVTRKYGSALSWI